jgi:benzoate transport
VDPRTAIDRSPMSLFQIAVVGICLLANMTDGYDVLVMAFTSIPISDEWGLSGGQLGVLLSAGLIGMAVGSIFVAPLADRIGRRRLTYGCMILVSAGLLVSAFAAGPAELAVFRAATGIGIGGMLASLNVVVVEFCSVRRRGTAIGIFAAGYPIGGTLGGFAATGLIEDFGWRSTFVLGAVVTAILALLVILFVPESIAYLLERRPADALEKVNRTMARMGHPVLPALLEVSSHRRSGPVTVLRRGYLGRTGALSVAFACVMAGFYFVNTWTPKLLVSSGLSAKQGLSGGVLISLGGILGCLSFGLLALRVRPKVLTIVYCLLSAILLAVFVLGVGKLGPSLVVSVLLGIAMIGGISGLYTIAPGQYEPAVRGAAIGFVIGIGRVGAIVAPLLVGALVDAKWPVTGIYLLFVIPVVLAAVAVGVLGRQSGALTPQPAPLSIEEPTT